MVKEGVRSQCEVVTTVFDVREIDAFGKHDVGDLHASNGTCQEC